VKFSVNEHRAKLVFSMESVVLRDWCHVCHI